MNYADKMKDKAPARPVDPEPVKVVPEKEKEAAAKPAKPQMTYDPRKGMWVPLKEGKKAGEK